MERSGKVKELNVYITETHDFARTQLENVNHGKYRHICYYCWFVFFTDSCESNNINYENAIYQYHS